MNHDAKHSGGIFRRRPSTASTSSRLSIQSGRSGSASCPTSPRHSKHLPAISSISSSSANLNEVLTATTSHYYDGPRHLHRSPSANTYNYRQQSSGHSYTGLRVIFSWKSREFSLIWSIEHQIWFLFKFWNWRLRNYPKMCNRFSIARTIKTKSLLIFRSTLSASFSS